MEGVAKMGESRSRDGWESYPGERVIASVISAAQEIGSHSHSTDVRSVISTCQGGDEIS